MPKRDESDEGLQPRRWLEKQDAIRHLLHAGIRLVMKMEDPFVVHLVVQSVDKLLIDVAEKMGTYLEADWEVYIKDEYHSAFFTKYRETYNFLKHAKTDYESKLPVYDIMMINVANLFMCLVNYSKLYHVFSDHMKVYMGFMQMLMPQIIKMPEHLKSHFEQLESVARMTPKEYFDAFNQYPRFVPGFSEEVCLDLQDVLEFYKTPFLQLRKSLQS
jgi:hypothetical protein